MRGVWGLVSQLLPILISPPYERGDSVIRGSGLCAQETTKPAAPAWFAPLKASKLQGQPWQRLTPLPLHGSF